MHKLVFIFLLFYVNVATAQTSRLSAVVADSTTHRPLPGASVLLNDTALTADNDGRFTPGALPDGDYTLTLSYLGYPAHRTRFSVPQGNFRSLPDTLFLAARGRNLQEVVIIADAPPVSYRGDTTEYNASSFKVKDNAVVEDMLRVLPGLRVDRNGVISAQGKTVQRVLVDGKEFFGNDPAIATKNLPADMIDKVQLIDQKSELAQFTGIEDGQNTKVINLVTRKDRKKGLFGTANAGMGNDQRYEAGVNINGFSGERQLSLLARVNNINKSGFSKNEMMGMLLRDPNALNNVPNFMLSELFGINVPGLGYDGLTTTQYGGLNFNNDWGKRLAWRSSYFYNGLSSHNEYTRNRQNFLADTAWNYQQQGRNEQRQYEHRVETSADIKLSEKTSLKIAPDFSFGSTENRESMNFSSTTSDNMRILNEGRQSTYTTSTNRRWATDIYLRQQFRKKGHNLIVQLKPEFIDNRSLYDNQNNARYLNTGISDTINQRTQSDAQTQVLQGKVLYTYPLNRRVSLQVTESLRYSDARARRQAFNFDAVKQTYTNPDEHFSDQYNHQNFEHKPDILMAINTRKFVLNTGITLQQQTLHGHSFSKGYQVTKSYTQFLPHLLFKYPISKYRKLELAFRSDSYMPAMGQLQPLDDNSMAMITHRGNPDLKAAQSYQASGGIENRSRNDRRSQFLRMHYNAKPDDITDQQVLDTLTGRQLIFPVNVKGNYDAGLDAGASFQVSKNGSYVDAGGGGNYSHALGYLNGRAYLSKTWAARLESSGTVNFGERYSIHTNARAEYNAGRFGQTAQRSWNFSWRIAPSMKLPAGFSLDAQLDSRINTGLAAGYNTQINLLEATAGKTFGKAFSVQLSGRDLLNQNKSIRRNTGNGYIEDSRNTLLGRYFICSLVYKLRVFPHQKS